MTMTMKRKSERHDHDQQTMKTKNWRWENDHEATINKRWNMELLFRKKVELPNSYIPEKKCNTQKKLKEAQCSCKWPFFLYLISLHVGHKYQHPKNKDENEWMPSSCLTNNVTRFCYNFLLKFKFAAATKQEAFLFVFFWGKNKGKRQHVWKLRRTSAKPFCNPMVSWFRMRECFCVWVKVKHIELINNPFYPQAASWFCMKDIFEFE